MSEIHGIAYTSLVYRMSAAELTAWLEDARRSNASVGVTGVLLHHAGRLFEYFEGEEDAVRRTRDRIVASACHHSLRFLLDDVQPQRWFSSWHLGFCDPPQNDFQVMENAQWLRAMPMTRTTLERSQALALVLSYWSRWVADTPGSSGPVDGAAP